MYYVIVFCALIIVASILIVLRTLASASPSGEAEQLKPIVKSELLQAESNHTVLEPQERNV